jgi:predicted TIM-barrel enzyme
MLTDQGIIEGEAFAVMRKRAALAPDVLVFADHLVKHATPLAPVDERQSVRDLRHRGLADAVVVDGIETGKAVDPERLRVVRETLPDAPLVIGSGLTAENADAYGDADAAIAGTSIKTRGEVDAPVDADRVARLRDAFKRRGGP